MLFENLRVNRIVVHEVFQRASDRSIVPPVFGDALETMSPEAMGAFRLRMTDALSGQSQSLQLRIAKHGAESFVTLAESLIGIPDRDFLAQSRAIATKLAEAQTARRIPGGVVIAFDGQVASPAVPLFGVIKAETQAGFRRSRDGERLSVEFLQNIFLTPATRLYKIGLVLFDDRAKPAPDGRRVFVFDSNISISNREAAAAYFYEIFLGCALPSDGPYETAKFFDLTKEFIRRSNLDPEQKRDTIDSLYVFVRDEKDPTFTADQFAGRFLLEAMRDEYSEFMRGRRFTPNAVVRDTSSMGNRLRRRKLKFGADIELSASPEALINKVQIKAIKGEEIDGERPDWTQITIREALTGEQ
jgi:hypothetical protein